MLAIFASIESGGDPTNRTGSYKGLFQLSDSEFSKWGYGNIWNANDNARAAAAKLRAEADDFRGTYGREPTPVDIYMQHQQGVAGYAAHMSNPDAPAWENMWSTGEGRSKGADWAKRAIWGNVPTRFKRMFGDVESITSREFVDMWDQVIKTKGKVGEFRDAVDISEETPDSLTVSPVKDERVGLLSAAGGDSIGDLLTKMNEKDLPLVPQRKVSKPFIERTKGRPESSMIEDRRGDHSLTDKEISKMFPAAMTDTQMKQLEEFEGYLDTAWEALSDEMKAFFNRDKNQYKQARLDQLRERFKLDNENRK